MPQPAQGGAGKRRNGKGQGTRGEGKPGGQGKAKKEARKAEQAKKQAQLNVLREARELGSPLEGLPPAFSAFKRNGVDASLEFATAKTLAQADRLAIHAILTENMAPIYGKSEWEEEAKADKEKELEEPDTRLLLVRIPFFREARPMRHPSPLITQATISIITFFHGAHRSGVATFVCCR